MDPVSHAVLGRAITAAVSDSGPPPRGIGAAAVLGALSPDVDFVLMPFGWDIYLRAHEIGSHALVGAMVTGLASAGLVRAVRSGSRYRALAGAAVMGAVSHVLADIAAGARVRPGWPFVDSVASLPLVAMGDPASIAILLAGAVAMWRFRTRAAARAALVALLAFLTIKGALLSAALGTIPPDGALGRTGIRLLEARWGSVTGWHAYDRTADALRLWRVDSRAAAPTLILDWPLAPGAEPPLVRASRSLDTVRNFLHVHDLGFAVERVEGANRRAVLWSDIRYCWQPEPGDESASSGALHPEQIACALWFGGIFDRDGRVLTQQVRVGSWTQNRSFRDQ